MVVEGLYSMDGDIPDLRGLQAALGAAWLMVDEAHAFGLLGPGGRGAAAAQGVEPDVIVATLGKALGQVGGVVVGPPVLRELLLSSGRAFIFSTALPEGVVQAARVALRLADDERRGRLADRVRRLRSGLAQLGLPALGHHQIAPLVLGPQTMAVAQELLSRGYYVPGIRPPTVPLGQERLRITVCSEHSDHQIDGLLEALDQCCTSTRHS
jgi:7-keto-8-aminopelargonate synthetase-like enzyme